MPVGYGLKSVELQRDNVSRFDDVIIIYANRSQAFDVFAVEAGAIGAAEVFKEELLVVLFNLEMPSAYQGQVIEAQSSGQVSAADYSAAGKVYVAAVR